jgi:hypothetical protein
MDNIRELYRILNEKDRNIVPDYIPVPFLGIKFDGEPSDVSDGIRTSSGPKDS